MKKMRFFSLLMGLVMVITLIPGAAFADTARADVAVNEANFPDPVFREYVSENFDTDGGGALSEAEIAQAKAIYLSFETVSTLKGVEFLTALEKLWAPKNLTELDVSRNTALTHLHCWRDQFGELDLSNNTALIELWVESCQLTKLDVSHNTALTELRCSFNQFTELDLSNNTLLTNLNCTDSPLKTLMLPEDNALQVLYCGHNQLTELDLSDCTSLSNVNCMDNQLTSLDLSGCTSLGVLDCYSNQLNTLDVSECTSLSSLNCSNNLLSTLDVSHNAELVELWCDQDQLTALDVSNNTHLDRLTCSGNKIEILDISNCPGLNRAYFDGTVEENYADLDYADASVTGPFGDPYYRLRIDKSTDVISSRIGRIAGKNRFLTAIEAADKLKAELGMDSFPNIVIASGTDFPDALTGAYLAIEKDAPVLLTNAGFAPTLAEYAKTNLQDGGTVYILGGKGAVPEVMEAELQKQGITKVERLAGSNRYDTNLEILKAAGVTGKNLLICSGTGYADSLSASALDKPILLVGSSLTQEQKDFLAEVKDDMSGDFFVLGGTGVVSESVFDEVKEYAKGTTERVSGANRFATSVAIARRFLPNTIETAVLAYAMNYPDGLAGGPVAYATGSPLLLVTDTFYDEAQTYAKQVTAQNIIIMGGKSLIPHYTARALLV